MQLCRITLLSAALVAGAAAAVGPPATAATTSTAPLAVPADGAIAGQYVVVLRAAAAGSGGPARARRDAEPALERARSRGVRIQRQFLHAINAYTATLSAAQLAAVRADPAVAYVAQDGRAHTSSDWTSSTAGGDPLSTPAVQDPVPSWGLDRIDQRTGPLDQAYHYDGDGAGVTVYMIDSGIRPTHQEYAGRVAAGFSSVPDSSPTEDCNGHGTHTAGTVGGRSYGVAKAVTLVPVQVLGCNGFGAWSQIIAGIDWVTANHSGPSVANMSLGGGAFQPVDDAVTRSIASGVSYAISAGNDDVDACERSPARTPLAITVAAITSDDSRWRWPGASSSDYGPCVDLFAPGDGIPSASAVADDAIEERTGTSMAAPHVAGVAALYLQRHPDATPAQVTAAILGVATPDAVTDAGPGSPNLLLYSGADDPTTTTTTTTTSTGTTPGDQPETWLQAEQRTTDGDLTDNAIRPRLQLRNTGSSAVDLTGVSVRYWFTRDGGPASFLAACDYIPQGCSNVRLRVVTLPAARPGADSYLEVFFEAGSIPAGGSTGELQLRVHKSDWSAFDERDDASHATGPELAPSSAVTVYAAGRPVWGQEP